MSYCCLTSRPLYLKMDLTFSLASLRVPSTPPNPRSPDARAELAYEPVLSPAASCACDLAS